MSKKNTNSQKIAIAPVGHFRPTKANVKELNCGLIRLIKFKPTLYRVLFWTPECILVNVMKFETPQKENEIIKKFNKISDKFYENQPFEYEDGTKVPKEIIYADAQIAFDYATEELIKSGAYKAPTKKEIENLPKTWEEYYNRASIA